MIITILHILVTGFLITTILLQMQGSGISSAFGGSSQFYRSKRSIERLLFIATIVLTCLFAVLSIVLLIPS